MTGCILPSMPRRPTAGRIYRPKYRTRDGSTVEAQVWWIGYSSAGKEIRESSKSTDWDEADRLLKRKLGEVATGKLAGAGPERIRMGALFDEFLRDYAANHRKSLYISKQRLERHLRKPFGELRAAQVTTARVRAYVEMRCAAGAAHATINRELAILRRSFQLALDAEQVARAPRIKGLRETNVREGFLERDGYVRLRQELPGYLRLALVVGYHLGCRKGEMLQLRPEDVDLTPDGKAGTIRFRSSTTKNDQAKVVPIYDEMGPWLEMALEEIRQKFPSCRYLFHNEGRQIQSFRKAWAAATKRAGVKGLLFHDLRRSAVRNLELAGVPRKVAMEITGHKTEAVYRRYFIVTKQDVMAAGRRMERYLAAGRLEESRKVPRKVVQSEGAREAEEVERIV
jgi:integrase